MLRASTVIDLADSSVTEALGRALARALPAAVPASAGQAGAGAAAAAQSGVSQGAVMYLQGDLGAGKTTCVRSLLRALGVQGLVRSPTYTLLETYLLPKLTCIHVDLYRLQVLSEVDELGLRDLFGPGCLLLVEWPERGGASLPPADVNVLLCYAGDARQARVLANTLLGADWLDNLDTTLA